MADNKKTTKKKNRDPRGNTTGGSNTGARVTEKAKQGDSLSRRLIWLVVFVAISFVIYVFAAGGGGMAGAAVSDFMFGMIGGGTYVLPLLMVGGCILMLFISNRHSMDLWVFFRLAMLLVFLCFFMQMVYKGEEAASPADVFMDCHANHAGGGFFGGLLAYILVRGVGLAVSYAICVLVILLIIISFIGKRLSVFLSAQMDKARENARIREERNAEIKAKKAEIEAKRKEEIHARRLARLEAEKLEAQKRAEMAERDKARKEAEKEAEREARKEALLKAKREQQEAERPIHPTEPDVSDEVTQEIPRDSSIPRRENMVRGILFENITETVPEVTKPPYLQEPVFEPIGEPRVSHVALEPVTPGSVWEQDQDEITENPTIEESRTITIDPVPTYEEEPIPAPEPAYQEEPIPEPEPLYEEEPVYEEEPIPEPTPEPEPVYEEEAIAAPEPVYQEEPIPEPEPVYEEEPIPEPIPEPGPIYEEESEPESISDIPEQAAADNPVREDEVEDQKGDAYVYPLVSLLNPSKDAGGSDNSQSNQETAEKLVNTLKNFGVTVTISEISTGPAVTRFEIIPQAGTKVSKIINLSDDIKLNLAAADIRIEAPIPGKSAIGIEVPNKNVKMVCLREIIESSAFINASSNIAFGAGKDIGGNIVVSDIAKMPHVLIAGATGSGKSVCINTIIMSILYKADPNDVKFIMIDPKVVELSVYNGIPHLLIPVVSDPKKAAGALNWAVREMNDRYQRFAEVGVRDMAGYNKRVTSEDFENENNRHIRLPQIVVIVDELADLMMVSSSEVEESICRLAQLARAAGIHLVIATQRPSVNVITGLIKANMPSRIAFAVTSGVDSRTILDMVGAEKLLGKGDMLYFPQGLPKPIRVQGAFVSDDEVYNVVNFIKEHNTAVSDEAVSRSIDESITQSSQQAVPIEGGEADDGLDAYFEACGRFIIEKEKASIGLLQRNFKIGFNRAARIMDQLGEAGVVGPEEGTKPRKILMNIEEFEDILLKKEKRL